MRYTFLSSVTKAAEKDVDHSPAFLKIAKDTGLAPYVCFASDIERYDLIDACIMAMPKNNLTDSLAYITHSFLRTLSSTLYKHGYAHTATLLRRFLVEDNIQQSKSKYYSYAASDMKSHRLRRRSGRLPSASGNRGLPQNALRTT
jgi:hypothetical protein